jgi:hypothetical protein
MHKEKVLRMSHKGFFLIKNTKTIFLGIFLGCYFENISNANLFDVFYRQLIESILIYV